MTRNLKAVKNRRFITIPFSATTLGVRIGSLAFNLAEAITALVQNGPLSSVQFTEITLADQDAKEAIGKSGAIVYTRLPIVNSVDLETFCPGGQSNIFVTDDSDEEPIVGNDSNYVDSGADPVSEDDKEEEAMNTISTTNGKDTELSAASQFYVVENIMICVTLAFAALWVTI